MALIEPSMCGVQGPASKVNLLSGFPAWPERDHHCRRAQLLFRGHFFQCGKDMLQGCRVLVHSGCAALKKKKAGRRLRMCPCPVVSVDCDELDSRLQHTCRRGMG